MAISIERYLVICRPFYRINCFYSSKIVILSIVSFSTLYNIPKFFEIQPLSTTQIVFKEEKNVSTICNNTDDKTHPQQGQNVTSVKLGYRIALTPLMHNPYYYNIYVAGLNIVFNGLIPFILLITLNTLILRRLIAKSKLEKQGSCRSTRTRKETVTSISSTFQGALMNLFRLEYKRF